MADRAGRNEPADFEREREHAEKIVAGLIGLIDKLAEAEKWHADKGAELARARSEAEQARTELVNWESRSWWRRALG